MCRSDKRGSTGSRLLSIWCVPRPFMFPMDTVIRKRSWNMNKIVHHLREPLEHMEPWNLELGYRVETLFKHVFTVLTKPLLKKEIQNMNWKRKNNADTRTRPALEELVAFTEFINDHRSLGDVELSQKLKASRAGGKNAIV